MKSVLFLFVFCGYLTPGFAQDPGNTYGPAIPKQETNTTDAIAHYIVANFHSGRDKLQAAYTWVINNIVYDTDSMYAINWNKGADARVTEALRRKKGVCENFAAIFNEICIKSGFTSYMVEGYTKQGGRVDRTGHSWCTVLLEDKWLLCDPTWDKDSRRNLNYFLAEPGEFIQSHMPFDPMWQLLDHPLTYREFSNGISEGKRNSYFNYEDSIKAYGNLNYLQRLQSSVLRMTNGGEANELVKNRIAYTNMLIGIEYEETDRKLYNAAVSELNRATAAFNEFVIYRNNHFLPERSAEQMNNMLDPIHKILDGAMQITGEIGRVIPDYQYDPAALIFRIESLARHVNEQKEFLKNYLAPAAGKKKNK